MTVTPLTRWALVGVLGLLVSASPTRADLGGFVIESFDAQLARVTDQAGWRAALHGIRLTGHATRMEEVPDSYFISWDEFRSLRDQRSSLEKLV